MVRESANWDRLKSIHVPIWQGRYWVNQIWCKRSWKIPYLPPSFSHCIVTTAMISRLRPLTDTSYSQICLIVTRYCSHALRSPADDDHFLLWLRGEKSNVRRLKVVAFHCWLWLMMVESSSWCGGGNTSKNRVWRLL